uniref:Uncharacterized protein n=1 Tax=Spermophilus dauricus TaxID=99837 RepID=A0A8C9PAC5_SPEDA
MVHRRAEAWGGGPWNLLGTYPPLRVGVRPKRVQSPTDMSSELSTVTTAARARPHLDLTMSILPGGQRGHIRAAPPPAPEVSGTHLLPEGSCARETLRTSQIFAGCKPQGHPHTAEEMGAEQEGQLSTGERNMGPHPERTY